MSADSMSADPKGVDPKRVDPKGVDPKGGARPDGRSEAGRMSVAEARAQAQREASERKARRKGAIASEFAGPMPAKWALTTSILTAVAIPMLGVIALWDPDRIGSLYFFTTAVAFAVGTALCAWAFVIAAGRSRYERVDLGRLVFGTEVVPSSTMAKFWAATAVQTFGGLAVAVAAAKGVGEVSAGSPEEGLNFFFGSMLGVLGMGLQLWWVARNGRFPAHGTQP